MTKGSGKVTTATVHRSDTQTKKKNPFCHITLTYLALIELTSALFYCTFLANGVTVAGIYTHHLGEDSLKKLG